MNRIELKAGDDRKPKKNIELFNLLSWLIGKEETVKNMVRKSEEEVKSILKDRIQEETVTELTVSIYDTERNQKARQYKLDIEKRIEEDKLRKKAVDVDYLAPFLAERGIRESDRIRPDQAYDLQERCLADLKQRLIDKANLIQKRFEAVRRLFLNIDALMRSPRFNECLLLK